MQVTPTVTVTCTFPFLLWISKKQFSLTFSILFIMTPQTQSNWKSGFLFLVPPVEQENVKQHNTLTEAQQLQRIISENDWAFLIKYDYNHNSIKKVALLLGWDYNDTTGVSDYAVIADGYTAAMIRASKFMQAKTGVSDFLKWADHLKI